MEGTSAVRQRRECQGETGEEQSICCLGGRGSEQLQCGLHGVQGLGLPGLPVLLVSFFRKKARDLTPTPTLPPLPF